MTRQEYVAGLRELADWVESSECDVDDHLNISRLRFYIFVQDKDELDEQARLLGGMREKVLEGSFAVVRRSFGPHKVEINVSRDTVCRKVQTGERIVPATEERVEPVYEWECDGFTVVR